jgi:stage V sporulation protein G
MKITDIKIQIIKQPKNKLRGFASVTFDESLIIKDFQIFQGKNGYFLGMPSRKMPNGEYREIVFSISTSLSEALSETVLRAFDDEINRPDNNFC